MSAEIGTAVGDTDTRVVGVDVGIRELFVAAPSDTDAAEPECIGYNGERARCLFNELGATTKRLQVSDEPTHADERAVLRGYRAQLLDELDDAIAALLDAVRRWEPDAVAVEHLEMGTHTLREHRTADCDASTWVMPTFVERASRQLRRAGYRVVSVSSNGTTRDCHHCGREGSTGRGMFSCHNDHCPVDAVDRDASAAVAIATRGVRTLDQRSRPHHPDDDSDDDSGPPATPGAATTAPLPRLLA